MGVEVIVGGGAALAEGVKVNVSFRSGREGAEEPEEEEILLGASYSHKIIVSCSLVSLAMVRSTMISGSGAFVEEDLQVKVTSFSAEEEEMLLISAAS